MPRQPYDWRPVFLAALREVPVVTRASDAAGVHRTTAWREYRENKEFAESWDDAMEAGVDKAEQEAFRRAVEGTEKNVWHQGNLVGTDRVYSDTMLALILKGRRKKVYADRTELTGAEGGPVGVVDDTARSARVAQLMALAQQRKAATPDDDETAGGLV